MIIAAQTPIPTFACPSKREMRPYPLVRNGFLARTIFPLAATGSCPVVRGDYQANSGNLHVGGGAGPAQVRPLRQSQAEESSKEPV